MVNDEGNVIAIIGMGELDAVRQRIENFIQRVGVNIGVEHLKETMQVRAARILRKRQLTVSPLFTPLFKAIDGVTLIHPYSHLL